MWWQNQTYRFSECFYPLSSRKILASNPVINPLLHKQYANDQNPSRRTVYASDMDTLWMYSAVYYTVTCGARQWKLWLVGGAEDKQRIETSLIPRTWLLRRGATEKCAKSRAAWLLRPNTVLWLERKMDRDHSLDLRPLIWAIFLSMCGSHFYCIIKNTILVSWKKWQRQSF